MIFFKVVSIVEFNFLSFLHSIIISSSTLKLLDWARLPSLAIECAKQPIPKHFFKFLARTTLVHEHSWLHCAAA